MRLSSEFTNLKARIIELEHRFLNFDNADSFIQENQDKLMSFRLLCNAEIEYYLEERAKSTINKYLSEWRSGVLLPGFKYLFLYSANRFDSDSFI